MSCRIVFISKDTYENISLCLFTRFDMSASANMVIKSRHWRTDRLCGKRNITCDIELIEAELGHTRELNLEYFRRIDPTYSIRADLYLLQSSQEVSKAIIRQNELGLRFNYLFRY